MLEEVAKLWKAEGGGVIVEDGEKMKAILKTLEGCMSGGRIGLVRTNSHLSRQSSFAFGGESANDAGQRPGLEGRHSSFGISGLRVEEDHAQAHDNNEDDSSSKDPRAWLKVISAFDQPRFTYDAEAKHFQPITTPTAPSLFPSAKHKTALFKTRYNIIHQRLLRNEAFQAPSFSSTNNTSASVSRRNNNNNATTQQFYKLTPISNLLGRGGSSHLLLALLAIAPTGTLCLHDPSGSIALDLAHAAQPVQDSAYFVPGMLVLVDGVYDEEFAGAGSAGLGGTGGVGGMIGGRFVGFSISCPPVERRNVSLGVELKAGDAGGGFGWTDFLGVGSERAVGSRMRRLERRLLGGDEGGGEARRKMVILGEVTLDQPLTLLALRKLLSSYSSSDEKLPMAFLLTGNFSSQPSLAGTGTGSIEYKELFDALAAILADFPSLLRNCTWIFVPGDNDAWSSAFSAGASAMLPRDRVPEVFTRRVMRVFASARAEPGARKAEGEVEGEVVWTSNPARVSLFGPAHEVVVFRDDVEGRLRRNAVRVGQSAKHDAGRATPAPQQNADLSGHDVVMSGALPMTETDPEIAEVMTVDSPAPEPAQPQPSEEEDYATAQAKKLILTLLPQSTLSPFPATVRPVHWDYATSALSLYPLPHTLVLADAEAKAFALTYEGCHVLNPGRFVTGAGRAARMGWVEYDCWSKRGVVRGMRVE